MWLLFGLSSIAFAILNMVSMINDKESKWFRFISLSLTALTVCFFYQDAANRVVNNDFGGLMDILSTTSIALWVCVIASIIINSFSLFKKH